MPRPKPLVPLHGAVNFDRLVPFDSAPNAPALAVNDILVMRRAAGGDNVTLSIGDITATGAVNIDQLLGGNNNDMLFRRAGIWTPTGPEGLSYDGFNFILTNDNQTLQGTSQIFGAGSGAWTQSSTGDIVQSGTGNIEISGTGNLEINGGGNFELDTGAIELTNNAEINVSTGGIFLDNGAEMSFEGGNGITMESGAGILIESTGGIVLDGSGDIELDSGRVQSGAGTAGAPSFTWPGDTTTGFFNEDEDGRIRASIAGTERFLFEGNEFKSLLGSGPAMLNVGASGSVPTIVPNQADPDTGLTRSGVNQSSIVNGGVEALRLRSTTASIAAHTNLFVFDYDNGQLEIVSVGAADSGGAGFKLLRIAN